MQIQIRRYSNRDLPEMLKIWNDIVNEGIAFPQDKPLTAQDAELFFASQTYCAAAINNNNNRVCGLYILHPNNIGRCGHICNASYAVAEDLRGMHIGKALVLDCIKQARLHDFKILQFNAVVARNICAQRLYEQLRFVKLGRIPGGFLLPSGEYEDIFLYYHIL